MTAKSKGKLRPVWTDDPTSAPGVGEAFVTMSTDGDAVIEDAPWGKVARVRIIITVWTGDGRSVTVRHHPDADAPLIPADAPGDLRDALLEAWLGVGRPGAPRLNPATEVARYRTEVARRIVARETTAIAKVVSTMNWSSRTVRRHIQAAGYRDWPAFVAACREDVAR
jgi:hypothetical protein